MLREEGIRIGGVGIRLYRPFPDEVIAEVLANAHGVIILEKAISYGYVGPLASISNSEHLALKAFSSLTTSMVKNMRYFPYSAIFCGICIIIGRQAGKV